MRKRAVTATLVVLFLVSGPSSFGLGNPCQKYMCEQTVTEYGASDPYCAETGNGMWVECRVERECIYIVGEGGRMTRQCTAYDCSGELCFWI